MWQAKITDKKVNKGVVNVTVKFTDGSTTFDESFIISGFNDPDGVRKLAQSILDNLNNAQAYADALVIGDIAPIVKPDTTAIDAFFEKYKKFRALQVSVQGGFLKPDDADLVALTSDIKAILIDKPEYQDDVRWIQK